MTFVELCSYYLVQIIEQIGILSLTTAAVLVGIMMGIAAGWGISMYRKKKPKESNEWDELITGEL